MMNFTNVEVINREDFTLTFQKGLCAVEHSVRTGLYVPDGILDKFHKGKGLSPATSSEMAMKSAKIIETLKGQAEALGLKILEKTRKNGFSFWVELPQSWEFKMIRKGDIANVSRYEIKNLPEEWKID